MTGLISLVKAGLLPTTRSRRRHRDSSRMYITCQQEMDFGEAYNNVVNRSLNKYFFKSLPHVELEGNQWLREHAMECFVWAQKVAPTCSTAILTPKVSWPASRLACLGTENQRSEEKLAHFSSPHSSRQLSVVAPRPNK